MLCRGRRDPSRLRDGSETGCCSDLNKGHSSADGARNYLQMCLGITIVTRRVVTKAGEPEPLREGLILHSTPHKPPGSTGLCQPGPKGDWVWFAQRSIDE